MYRPLFAIELPQASEVADMYPACLIGSRAVALMGVRAPLVSLANVARQELLGESWCADPRRYNAGRLVMLIALSMVMARVIAGFAGATVPIVLTKFGLDPAQSSLIVLTNVTDIAGFFSFIGIATLLSAAL